MKLSLPARDAKDLHIYPALHCFELTHGLQESRVFVAMLLVGRGGGAVQIFLLAPLFRLRGVWADLWTFFDPLRSQTISLRTL